MKIKTILSSNFLSIAALCMLSLVLTTQAFAAYPGKTANSVPALYTFSEQNQAIQTLSMPSINASQPIDALPVDDSSAGKSQLVALLLCIFVGGLGIHRFYLGYTTIGIIQLLTLGGCGIWALIDLIRIITGDLKPKGGNYETTI